MTVPQPTTLPIAFNVWISRSEDRSASNLLGSEELLGQRRTFLWLSWVTDTCCSIWTAMYGISCQFSEGAKPHHCRPAGGLSRGDRSGMEFRASYPGGRLLKNVVEGAVQRAIESVPFLKCGCSKTPVQALQSLSGKSVRPNRVTTRFHPTGWDISPSLRAWRTSWSDVS